MPQQSFNSGVTGFNSKIFMRGMDGYTFVILFCNCNSKIICLAFRDLFLNHELRKANEGLIIVFIYNRYLLTS